MAKSSLEVRFKGETIRTFGGNTSEVRCLYQEYQEDPAKYHPWMREYSNYKELVKLFFNKG